MADTDSIAVSDAEDCNSEDDSRAVNSVQASKLQEINKLIKEAERLCAMADTAAPALLLAVGCRFYEQSELEYCVQSHSVVASFIHRKATV